MIVELNVPFDEKEHAKAMGARWNPVKKTWYVVDCEDLSVFSKWFYYWQKQPNKERTPTKQGKQSKKKKVVKAKKGPRIHNPITIGRNYIKIVSDSVPW
jgi:hypothetical protein